MKGLDTNVLVRYLVQDDPAQSVAAVRELDRAVARGERVIIAPIVLCELVWVLETAYDFHRTDVASTLEQILRTAQFEVLDKDLVWAAWKEYQTGKGDFADYYLGLMHRRAGADRTLTFDRGLARSAFFEVLPA